LAETFLALLSERELTVKRDAHSIEMKAAASSEIRSSSNELRSDQARSSASALEEVPKLNVSGVMILDQVSLIHATHASKFYGD